MSLLETAKGILFTARITFPTVADAAIGRLTPEICDHRLLWWAESLMRDANVHVEVRGREHLDASQSTFVVMSNHQSLYDIPILYVALRGRRLRMVAKAELFRVPFWGRAMRAAGFVRVDRGDRAQAIASLQEGAGMLEQGTLLWIAPEGTRSETGELGPFKSGGFHVALSTGHPILPVAIDGARDVLRARGYVVQKDQRVRVTILPPIDPRDFGADRKQDLMDAVRAAISSAL